MQNPDVIIIGGGISGLTAAGLLSSRGVRVLLTEKEPHAGGYVWGFRRNGFYFDATGAFLSACSPGGEFHDILKDMGIIDRLSFKPIGHVWNIYPDFDLRVDYRDPSAYLDALRARFPDKDRQLKAYQDLTLRLGREFTEFEKAPRWRRALLPLLFPGLLFHARQSHARAFKRFFEGDRRIPLALSSLPTTLPPDSLSYLFVAVLWAKVLNHGVHYPEGGMKSLSTAMAEGIIQHGGQILCDQAASGVLVRRKKAAGIELEDGRRIESKWVVGGINPYMGERLLPDGVPLFRRMHRLDRFKPSLSALLFYIGLPAETLPPDWPYFISLCTGHDLTAMHSALDRGSMEQGLHMVITTPSILDPSLAPPGHHSLKVLVHAPRAREFHERYGSREKLDRLRDHVFSRILEFTGVDIGGKARFVEEATPMTLLSLTGNEGGAMYGFDAACDQVGPLRPPNRTALDNLLWVGHYTHPSHGIVGSAMSGRFAAEIILSSGRS